MVNVRFNLKGGGSAPMCVEMEVLPIKGSIITFSEFPGYVFKVSSKGDFVIKKGSLIEVIFEVIYVSV